MREIYGLGAVQTIVKVVGPIHRASLNAFSTRSALVGDETRFISERHQIVPSFTLNLFYLRQGRKPHMAVLLDTPEIDLQATIRWAQLGKISTVLCHATAEVGGTLYQVNRLPQLCCLHCSGQAADTTSHYEYARPICLSHQFLLKAIIHWEMKRCDLTEDPHFVSPEKKINSKYDISNPFAIQTVLKVDQKSS
jgi:hypothetical protein